jgi:hypothetical protein
MDRTMMQAFSRRTVERLARHTLFGLALPAFQSFLDINVRKEIDKDRRVIVAATEAVRAGRTPSLVDAEQLLHEVREIDQAFLQQAAPFPLAIDIRYPDIEPTRRQRIERLLAMSYRLLAHWQSTPRFRQAVAQAYTREQFHTALGEILHLYALETKSLNRSVRLPTFASLARDKLAETIYLEMEAIASQLADELTDKAYRRHRCE